MYVARAAWPSSNGKSYTSIYLRESYRDGPHVRKRDIANLTHCDPREIAAIELALKHKGNLSVLGSLDQSNSSRVSPSAPSGPSLKPLAASASTPPSVPTSPANSLSGRSSPASSIRVRASPPCAWPKCMPPAMSWASAAALTKTISTTNLGWLSQQQESIEKQSVYRPAWNKKPDLFLYDVTSSYLEGDDNALGAYGYNRDGKKGKKQIVIGLLCDEQGEPVSTEVFRGNTQDPATFASQVKKASQRFGCERVTFVGDRGMIKSGQIEDL